MFMGNITRSVKLIQKMGFLAVLLTLLAIPFGSAFSASIEVPSAELPAVRYLAPGADVLSLVARTAIVDALAEWDREPPRDNLFYLLSLRWEEDWALATMTADDLAQPLPSGEHPPETNLTLENLFLLLLVEQNGAWQAAIEWSPRMPDLLATIPDSELPLAARTALFDKAPQIGVATAAQAYNNYKFPWRAGEPWWVTTSWHDSVTWSGRFSTNNSIDFAPSGDEAREVVAAAPGTVTYICPGAQNALVVIRTDNTNESLGYLHLDTGSVQGAGIQEGTHVDQGRKIGNLRTGPVSDNCGYSSGAHVHLYFPTRPFTIDGRTFSDGNVHAGGALYSSQGSSSGGDTMSPGADYSSPSNGTTVTSRSVRLTAWASDDGSGVKWVKFNAKFNDQWRTVHEDWSAPYEFDWDLCNSGVPDGDIELGLHVQDKAGNEFHLHTKHANPHITKRYDCNPVHRPSRPALATPGNGSRHPSSYDLTFQWQGVSGATGYLIEWWGGPYDAMQPCKWTGGTSCHIGQIVPGNTYYWHVKARNSAGEGDWSDTWSFIIQPAIEAVQALSLSPQNPYQHQVATARFEIRNAGSQAVTLRRVLVVVRGPNCSDWDCPSGYDFPADENITLQPGQTYAYNRTQRFPTTGGSYFALPVYQDIDGVWHGDDLANNARVTFSVSAGLEIVEDLSLSSQNPGVGQDVTARFKVRNASGQILSLRRLGAAGKGPDCSDWTCTHWADFPWVENLTLQPEETYLYERQRTFGQAGSGYFTQPMYSFGEDDWQPFGTKINFAVSNGLRIVEPLTLSPATPAADQTVIARYRIRNDGDTAITLRRLGVVARGPACADWICANHKDFPPVETITLQPGQEHQYEQQRTLDHAGSGYFAEPAYEDANGWWFPMPGSSRLTFDVSEGLALVEDLSFSPRNPIAGQTITARFRIKNGGTQAVTLRRLTVGAKGPNCTAWDCPNWGDFPALENITLAPGEERAYHGERTYTQSGNGYFAQVVYERGVNEWRHLGTQIDFSVAPGLTVAQQVSLTPAQPVAGLPVTASFTLENVGNGMITLPRVAVGGRGPGCTDYECPNDAGFAAVDNITLHPGETYHYSQVRIFDQLGEGYFVEPAYEDTNGWWFVAPNGERTTFTVSEGLNVVEDLSLSPADPVAGEIITARFKLQNASDQAITLRRLMVGAKGPNCSVWDCPNWGDFPVYEYLTLEPGETFTYNRQRFYTEAGNGYFAQIVTEVIDRWWYHYGTQIDFSVASGLQVAEQVSLSPAQPITGQPVTARFALQNVGNRTITLSHVGASGRGPDCADYACANDAGFAAVENVTLEPGRTFVYSAQRTFVQAGAGYFAEPAFADSNGWWFVAPGAQRLFFEVDRGIELVNPLQLTPSDPAAGEPLRASFTVRNASTQVVTLRRIGVGMHGPRCVAWDCPNIADFPWLEHVTLQPDETLTFDKQRTFVAVDGGYLAQISLQFTDQDWQQLGQQQSLAIGPGLTLVEPLTLTPAEPLVGQSVTAHMVIQNESSRTIALPRLGAVGRGPDCIHFDCTRWADYPLVENLTLQPGQRYTYHTERTYTEGGSYFAEPQFEDANDWWSMLPGGARVNLWVRTSTSGGGEPNHGVGEPALYLPLVQR